MTPEDITDLLENRLFVMVDGLDHDLIDSGELDSLRFVELLLLVEQMVGQKVPVHELDLDGLRTPRTIAKTLNDLLDAPSSEV